MSTTTRNSLENPMSAKFITPEADVDPDSPEAILERLTPQWRDMIDRRDALDAEDNHLRSVILEISTRASRHALLEGDEERRKAAWDRVREIDTVLFDLRRQIDSMHPRILAARGAVEGNTVDPTSLNALTLAAQAVLDRLVADQQAAFEAREKAYAGGTAEHAFRAERALRTLPDRIVVAQRAVVNATIAELFGEQAKTGRQKWAAEEAVKVAAQQIVDATAAHRAALETSQAVDNQRVYLGEQIRRLQAQLGADLSSMALQEVAA